jgi:glycosyltransferase involved in cell wall biosynthesis
MALGVPCVVSSVGGVPEIAINGENCETFNYGNVEETAEKIIKLFSDNELKEKYSQNAKQFIKDLYGINDYPSLNEIYTTFVKR